MGEGGSTKSVQMRAGGEGVWGLECARKVPLKYPLSALMMGWRLMKKKVSISLTFLSTNFYSSHLLSCAICSIFANSTTLRLLSVLFWVKVCDHKPHNLMLCIDSKTLISRSYTLILLFIFGTNIIISCRNCDSKSSHLVEICSRYLATCKQQ